MFLHHLSLGFRHILSKSRPRCYELEQELPHGTIALCLASLRDLAQNVLETKTWVNLYSWLEESQRRLRMLGVWP